MIARPFPPEWRETLRQNVLVYGELSDDERQRVREYVQVFVAEKHWEGCGGLTMTDEIRVTIAAQAAVLVLGMPQQYFERVSSILVYPATYVAPESSVSAGGVVSEGMSVRLGEAWYRGPVIFSWAEVLAGGRRTTRGNVVYHEFAHQLDMLNGRSADGTPPLESAAQDRRWLKTTDEAYRRLALECDRGLPTFIDCYGATNRAEFFAVATETFFTQPQAMRERHPQLYAVFCEVYRQDPASRATPD